MNKEEDMLDMNDKAVESSNYSVIIRFTYKYLTFNLFFIL